MRSHRQARDCASCRAASRRWPAPARLHSRRRHLHAAGRGPAQRVGLPPPASPRLAPSRAAPRWRVPTLLRRAQRSTAARTRRRAAPTRTGPRRPPSRRARDPRGRAPSSRRGRLLAGRCCRRPSSRRPVPRGSPAATGVTPRRANTPRPTRRASPRGAGRCCKRAPRPPAHSAQDRSTTRASCRRPRPAGRRAAAHCAGSVRFGAPCLRRLVARRGAGEDAGGQCQREHQDQVTGGAHCLQFPKKAGTMSTNRIFTIVIPGKIIA